MADELKREWTKWTGELKPCPFCGYEPGDFFGVADGDIVLYGVACQRCRQAMTKLHKTKKEAAAKWNSRRGKENARHG